LGGSLGIGRLEDQSPLFFSQFWSRRRGPRIANHLPFFFFLTQTPWPTRWFSFLRGPLWTWPLSVSPIGSFPNLFPYCLLYFRFFLLASGDFLASEVVFLLVPSERYRSLSFLRNNLFFLVKTKMCSEFSGLLWFPSLPGLYLENAGAVFFRSTFSLPF